MPNVFSPNGDDVNDKFTIYGNPALEEIEVLQIYDRWGELVLKDTTFHPTIQPMGGTALSVTMN